MTAINCDQFAKILDDKLSPLNSRIAELKKSVDEAMNHVEFVNGEYDELLQMMKTSNDGRKALKDEIKILQDENKILKATIDSIEEGGKGGVMIPFHAQILTKFTRHVQF